MVGIRFFLHDEGRNLAVGTGIISLPAGIDLPSLNNVLSEQTSDIQG
jgi:hypothetical protein